MALGGSPDGVFSLVYHYTATKGLVRSRFPPKNHWTIL